MPDDGDALNDAIVWECPDCGQQYCSCDEECTCDIGPIDECPIHYPIDGWSDDAEA